jgi:hypothetical protein
MVLKLAALWGVNIKKIAVAIGACGALDHFVSFVSDALYSLPARCINMSRPTRKAAKAHEERHLWIDCSQIMNHNPQSWICE